MDSWNFGVLRGRTRTRAYWCCNSGHYFSTLRCPFDGWGSEQLTQLHEAAQRLLAKGLVLSLAALQAEGVSDDAIQSAIVVEFGSEKAAFDAISPDYFVVDGKTVSLIKAGSDFH